MQKIELIRAVRIMNHVGILSESAAYDLIKKIVDLKEGNLSIGQER